MKVNIRKSLESIKQKANELSSMLSDPSITSDIDQLTKLNKEFSEVKDIVNNWDEYLELEKNIVDLEELLKDEEMRELASEEKKDNELKLQALEAQIMIQLLPKIKTISAMLSLSLEQAQEEMRLLFLLEIYIECT